MGKSQVLPLRSVSKDKVLFMQTYGVRSLKTKQPVDEHTLFRIGSLSKGFTAELTGLMVDCDILQWDDKVLQYLPDFKLHDNKDTIALTIRDIQANAPVCLRVPMIILLTKENLLNRPWMHCTKFH